MTDPLPANPSAITGFGCISPLGAGVDKQVRAIADDAVGLGPYRAMEQAGEVAEEGLRGGECAELGQPRVHERAARGLAQAAAEALHDAGVATDAPPYPPERIGAVLGTSLHGMNAAGAWLRGEPASTFGWFQGGHVLAHALQSLPVGGPRVTCSSACASALSSVAHARTWLEAGLVDLVLCGGYDPVSEYTVAGFHALRVVSLDRLRPFAEDRQGMQVSEGYAVFVLERSADAAARGHVPRSLVTGMGESSDAFHLTKPHPDGVGAAAVLRDALQDAALAPADIDLVVAHATGTRDNDAAEAQAVRAVFDADAPPVTALKSRVGHTLGAAGALEAGLAWACLAEGTLPATANVAAQDVGEPVDLVIGAGLAAETPTRHLASCSLGFGGSNAVMIQTAPSAVGVSASQHERA
ncbi:MAG: beta-ketoacyl synthase N-terminal-like domain-containing protein, partial [Planctomycetota bacterium]